MSLDATTTPARLTITADYSAFGSGPVREGRVSIQGAGGTTAEVVVCAVTLVVLAQIGGTSTSLTPGNGRFELTVDPRRVAAFWLRVVADVNGNGSLEDAGDYDSGSREVHVSGGYIDVGVLTARRR